MPDSEASRLARLEQRVDSLENTVSTVSPMRESFAELRSDVHHLKETMGANADRVDTRLALIEKSMDDRDKSVSAERRQTRIALWSVVGVLGSATITAITAIIVAIVGGGGHP